MTPAAIPVPSAAEVALDQFARRRAWLLRSRKSEAEIDRHLRPWAALALRAGAPLARLPADVQAAIEDYRRASLSESHARACVAEDLCPKAECLAELARVRDLAFNALTGTDDDRKRDQARHLQALADHFGTSPWHPVPADTREAA